MESDGERYSRILRRWADELAIPSGDFVNVDLRVAAAELDRLRSELATKDARINELVNEVKILGFSLSEFDQYRLESKAKDARIAELDATWLNVCDQRDAMRKELAEAKAIIANLDERSAQYEAALKHESDCVEASSARIAEDREEHKLVLSSEAALRRENEATRKELAEAKSQLGSARKQLETIWAVVSGLNPARESEALRKEAAIDDKREAINPTRLDALNPSTSDKFDISATQHQAWDGNEASKKAPTEVEASPHDKLLRQLAERER